MCGNCEKQDVKLSGMVNPAVITKLGIKISESKDGTNLTTLGDIIEILRTDKGEFDSQLPEPYELGVGVKLFGDCYAKLVRGEIAHVLNVLLFDGAGATRGYINYNQGTDSFSVAIIASRERKIYYTTVGNSPQTLVKLHQFMTDEDTMLEMAIDSQSFPHEKVRTEIQGDNLQDIVKQVHDSRMASCDPITVDYGTLVNKWRVVSGGAVYDLVSYICGVESARYEKIFVSKGKKEVGSVWFEPNGALCIETPFYKGRFHLVHSTTWQPDYDAIAEHIKHFILGQK